MSARSNIHAQTTDTRAREKGDASKSREYLPADKQYLLTRGVPCLRRATALAYTDEDEDAERLLSFGDLSSTGKAEDEWVETHTGRGASASGAGIVGDIDEIPDVDDHADGITSGMGGLSLGSNKTAAEIPDIDEIPDMEEEGLEGEDEAAVAAPKAAAPAAGVIDARCARSTYLLHTRSSGGIVKSKSRRATCCKCGRTMS